MLAVGFMVFCLRYTIPEEHWSDRIVKLSFWSLNIGLAWMVFATLFPVGILQLYTSVSEGYYEARSLNFVTGGTSTLIEWIRLPGDGVFIVGGALPLVYLSALGLRHRKAKQALSEPQLFTDVNHQEQSETSGRDDQWD